MPPPDLPPYTRYEFERRMLVDPTCFDTNEFEPYHRVLTDHYVNGARFRLRKIVNSDDWPTTYRLTKKFPRNNYDYEPIVTTHLSKDEYDLLRKLPSRRIVKTRYFHNFLDQVFSIDEFHGPLDGLILCETEAESHDSLYGLSFPSYASDEVTKDAFFCGGALCQASAEELATQLRARGVRPKA